MTPRDKHVLNSAVLFVGEAPGEYETVQNENFVGAAGQLLDEAIQRAGHDPDYFRARINVVACRPPANRTPTPQEIAFCRPIFEKQVARAARHAKVIVPMGGTAFHAVSGLLQHRRLMNKFTKKTEDAYVGITDWRGYVVPVDDPQLPAEIMLGKTEGVIGEYKTSLRVKGWRERVAAGCDPDDPALFKHRKGDARLGKLPLFVPRLQLGEGVVEFIMPCLHPAGVIHSGFATKPAFLADIAKAFRLADGERPLAAPVYETRLSANWRENRVGRCAVGGDLCVDLETHGFVEKPGSVHRLGVSSRPGHAITVPFDRRAREWAKWLLVRGGREKQTGVGSAPTYTFVAHNLQFDRKHLEANGVAIVAGAYFDTLIAAQLLQPDLPKNLNYVSSLYLLLERWKHESQDKPEFYNACDAERLHHLKAVLVRELTRHGMLELFEERVMPAFRELADSTVRGIRVDNRWLHQWRRRLQRQLGKLLDLWERVAPGVNTQSPTQLREFFRTKVRGVLPSTDRYTMAKLAKDGLYEARLLLAIRKRQKLLGTYATNKHLRAHRDGNRIIYRVHPHYSPHKGKRGKAAESLEDRVMTASGRLSAADPNIQNQHPTARRAYIADKGYVMVEIDYEQIEAWLTVIECGDPVMRKILESGQKLHTWMWEKLKAEVDRHISYKVAKTIVHASNYGARWTMIGKILERDGVFLSAKRVKELLEYVELSWARRGEWQQEIVERAFADNFLVNAFGRRRWFYGRNDAPAAIAFIPSSNMADMVRTIEACAPWKRSGGQLLFDGHDSLGLQFPIATARDGIRHVVASMEREWPEIEPGWRCKTSVKWGKNWRDLKGV